MSLSGHRRHRVVMESAEKAEQLMILGVILHIRSGFGGGQGGWIRDRRGSCLSPNTSDGRCPAPHSLLGSPGTASSCSFPSFTPTPCSWAKSPPLSPSCVAVAAGLPSRAAMVLSGCGFSGKAGASQRPEAAGGLWCQLRVRRASPREGCVPQGDTLPPPSHPPLLATAPAAQGCWC